MKKLLTFIFLFSVNGFSFAAEPDSLFLKGNQSYTQGNYDQAIEYYNDVISAGVESPELYLNLGNAYFRIQDYGRARLFYAKAHRLNPFLSDLDSNIDLIQSFVTDKITLLPIISIKLSLFDWMSFFNSFVTLFIIILISLFSIYLVFVNSVSKFSGIKRYLFITSLTVTILFQLGLATYIYLDYSIDEAIVIDNRVDVKSEPVGSGTTVFTVHSATRVFIKNSYENWYYIQLENGNTGWLESKSIGKI